MAVTPHEAGATRGSVDSDTGIIPLPFRCEVAYIEDRAVVAVRGDIDIATAPALQREILATLTLPIRGVALDLSYVSFMDSSGVAVLVTARQKARDLGLALTLTSVPRQVRLVLELSGLSERFGLAEGSKPRLSPTSDG